MADGIWIDIAIIAKFKKMLKLNTKTELPSNL